MKNFVRIALYSSLCLKLYILVKPHHISVGDALFYSFFQMELDGTQLGKMQG